MKMQILKILKNQRFGIFTSVRGNIPHPTLVAFINSEDLSKIFFATTKKSRKFRNLIENPNVVLFWNTQTNKPDDVRSSVTLTGIGHASPLNDSAEQRRVKKIYITKHPYMQDFVNEEETALISVQIEKYELLSDFEKVKKYRIKKVK